MASISCRMRCSVVSGYFFDARLEKENDVYYVSYAGTRIDLPEDKQQHLKSCGAAAREVTLGVRPEHITLGGGQPGAITGKVSFSEMMGSSIHLHIITPDGQEVVAIKPIVDMGEAEASRYAVNSELSFVVSGSVVHLFDKETELNLL